jgi:hypothetical protein
MSFKHHPTEASILSVLNGTAAAAEQRLVSAHIAVCPRCRSFSERNELLLRELSDFSRHSSQSMQDSALRNLESVAKRRFSVPTAFRFSGGAIAATLLVLTFAWPRHIKTVSAAELLARAETAEVSTSTERRVYRLNVGATSCNTAAAYWSQPLDSKTNPCVRVRGALANANWDDQQILSARSYRKWHDALARHRDSVLHHEAYWTLKTDTDQGFLRSASLRVRSSDYRPVELTLEFSALQPVSVVEDEPAERRVQVRAARSDKLATSESIQHVDEPADAIEVEAWNMLRTLGGDSGWEATITRKGGEVRVVGFIDDASRQDKFAQAFSTLQGVSIDLNRPTVLPQRGSNGDGQPLAEHILETLIPDSHERGVKVTAIADASRAVLGKAYLHDQLVARHSAFQGSASGRALTPLIEEERSDLLAETARLSDLLEPLIETEKNRISHVPLNYSQARALDAAVLSLVNAAPKQSASLEQATGRVRSLLLRN